MSTVLFLLSVFAVAMTLLMVFTSWYLNFLLKHLVGRKHRLIEDILYTSNVPEIWSRGFNKKAARLGGKQDGREKAAVILQKAKASYLSKLDSLIKYLKTTPMVENEEVRREMLEQMQEIRDKWERRPIEIWIQT